MPSEVLGPHGIISVNNPLLQSLSLTTDLRCSREKGACKVDLSSLGQLQSLCWKAPNVYHFKALSDAIKRNSERLKKLELDFVDWPMLLEDLGLVGSDQDDGPQSSCASIVFGLTGQSPQLIFPAIRELSLTQVPLVAEMAGAINFDTLRSLTLRRCPSWDRFLTRVTERVTESGLLIRLKSLEIYECDNVTSGWGYGTIGRFLEAFDGLEELFIAYPGPEDTRGLWDHVTRHQATLTKFVHHQREVNIDDESPHYEKLQDLSDLALLTRDLRQMKEDPSTNPLSMLDLEFLGLCCVPERLVRNSNSGGFSITANQNAN